eukprot:scaffold34915_cov180-Amphora_coffeaeformis.AAC.22
MAKRSVNQRDQRGSVRGFFGRNHKNRFWCITVSAMFRNNDAMVHYNTTPYLLMIMTSWFIFS